MKEISWNIFILKHHLFLNFQPISVTKAYIVSEIKSGHLRLIPPLKHSDTERRGHWVCWTFSLGVLLRQHHEDIDLAGKNYWKFLCIEVYNIWFGSVKNKSGEQSACSKPCDRKPQWDKEHVCSHMSLSLRKEIYAWLIHHTRNQVRVSGKDYLPLTFRNKHSLLTPKKESQKRFFFISARIMSTMWRGNC